MLKSAINTKYFLIKDKDIQDIDSIIIGTWQPSSQIATTASFPPPPSNHLCYTVLGELAYSC